MTPDPRLVGRRILLVEDEYLQAFDVTSELLDRGAAVIGPVATLDAAIAQSRSTVRIDGAVVDVNLGGELAYPLVDELLQRDVPVVLTTAYAPDSVPFRFQHLPTCEKPFSAPRLADALGGLILGGDGAHSSQPGGQLQ